MVAAMVRCLTAAVLLALAPVACAQEARSSGDRLRTARTALHDGKYDEAIADARRAGEIDTSSAEPVRIEAAALIATGKYAEAETLLQRFIAAHPRNAELWRQLGEVQQQRGRLTDAAGSFRRAVEGRARDSLTAVLNLAILRFNRGEVDEALADFDRFIDIYNTRRGRLNATELSAVATACRYLGRNNPQLFKDAMRAYDEALAADSSDLGVRVKLGELFLEKYNIREAEATLRGVLAENPRHARALLAMARMRHFDEEGDAADFVRRSLEVNPLDPEARAFSALLVADLERYPDAVAEARRGLEADSSAPAALIALAAAQFLQGDTAAFRASLARVHAREPKSAEAEATLAEVAARTRLYAEAVAFAKAAVDRDPKASHALVFLGINTLRLGDIEQGRQYLERGFALDPYNVWAKNTLDMLDTFKAYTTVRTPRFELVIETKDAPLLSAYAQPLAEQAFDSLSARYGYRPTAPVRVEFYRSHDDFSVRTVGLGGLGALGVTFGRVVAMDSPAARRTGEFNWGSTLWHELAHVFTLGATNNRVPRWFAEGLSVYEERRARPSWGEDPSPLFLAAFAGGRLPKVSRMNDGFLRPSFPAQVVLSYYLASLVCEMIEKEHGIGAIRAMLGGYREGKSTDQLLRDVLKTDPAAFDTKAETWVRQRFERQLAAVKPLGAPREISGQRGFAVSGDFVDALEQGRKHLADGQTDQAVAVLERAKALFPEYAAEDGPYALLARIHVERGAKREAARELTSLTAINEDAFASNVALAGLLEELGDAAAATAALDRAVWINPFDAPLHERLARLAATVPDRKLAVRERQALVALDPVDRVEALYQLALAYYDAGDAASARREVLRALELAPNFEKAQALLLKLRASGSTGGS
jgi:cellulose synthase operon protein C